MPLIFVTSGSSWAVPTDWNNANNNVWCIGAGGGGGAGAGVGGQAGGGGGAASGISNLTLTPGTSVLISVGTPGAPGFAGGSTFFGSATLAASLVGAAGGSPGDPTTYIGGQGGAIGLGIGSNLYAGAFGGDGSTTASSGAGGGGGAAGNVGGGQTGGSSAGSANGGGGGGGGSNGGSCTYGGAGGLTGGRAGGNGTLGTGAGAAGGGAGTAGGGGGGGRVNSFTLTAGGGGGMDATFDATHGAGGGGGGGGGTTTLVGVNGGSGGGYGGGGGGGGGVAVGGAMGVSGTGAPGIIVISYVSTGVSATYSASNAIDTWLGLVPSQHSNKPKFMATLAVGLQPLADMLGLMLSLPAAFDLDAAVGAQLDAVGLWVGVTRIVPLEISNVYFSFDTDGLGWDQGSWWAPGDPSTTLSALPDDAFRTLIRARIGANHWDGTIPGAYAAWDSLFAGTTLSVLIEDLGAMNMSQVLIGGTPDVLTTTLFESGELDLTPAGVNAISVIGSSTIYSSASLSGGIISELCLGEI